MASDTRDFLQEYSSDLPIAPKLYMEFADPQTLEAFLDWVQMDREEPVSVTVEHSREDKFFKSLHRLSAQHKQHRIPEPSDADRTPAEPIPEDIHLMSPRRARRRGLVSMSMKRLTGSKQEARSTQDHDGNSEPITIPESPEASVSRLTRTRRATIIERSPTPKQWTEENPGWEEKVWRNSLVFPPQGKGRATVDADDIERLDEGEFLNDNLIIFYLRYLQDKLEKEKPRVAERIHFHNTFFYDKLKPSRSGAGINYNGVKGWTSKVDLFTKDFIVVPINEHQHWYVAIIYNPSKLDPSQKPSQATEKSAALDLTLPENEEPTKTAEPTMVTDSDVEMQDGPKAVETVLRKMSIQSTGVDSDAIQPKATPQHEDEQGKSAKKDVYDVDADTEIQQESPSAATAHRKTKKTSATARKHDRKHDPNQPKIITLDSLGAPHSPACTHLRQYLIAELKDKKGIEIPDPGALGMTAKKIPEQQNHCDCGLYLLGYVQHFLDDPDAFVYGLLQYDTPTWSFVSSEMRHSIRSLIFELQAKQQSREDAEQEAKRQRKRLAAEGKNTKSRPTSSEGNVMEPAPDSSSAVTQAGNPRQSEDAAEPRKPISHVTVDGSLILQSDPVTQSIEADGSVLGEDSLIELSPRIQTKTNAEGDTERTSPVNRPMPGAFPAPERLGSSETQKGFIQGIKSPESRGATSTNPYEVIDEVGGSLTRQLEEDLHNAKSPHLRSPHIRSPRVRSPLVRSPATRPTPRKVNARSDANTARKSVEVEEAYGPPKTNIEIPIQSSSPARGRDGARGPRSRAAETGTTSEFFSGATSQPQQEVLTDVQYKGQRKQCKARKEDDAPIIVD
ncbi:UDP-galactose transporter [Pestalotiopsis sp. IQ-011]